VYNISLSAWFLDGRTSILVAFKIIFAIDCNASRFRAMSLANTESRA